MQRIRSEVMIATLLAGLVAGCSDAAAGGAPAAEVQCCAEDEPAGASAGAAADQTVPKVEVLAGGVELPDVTLTNQDGEPVDVRADLFEGKVMVMNFVFTTCKGVCPPMGATYGALQEQLGGRLGSEVSLVSVTVDPVVDTPARLKAWGENFDRGPGWTLLTGTKQQVDGLLKTLGVYTADKVEHSPFVLIGRASDDRWQRVHGLTAAEKLAEVILGVLDGPDDAEVRPDVDVDEPVELEAQPADLPDSPAARYFTNVPLVDQRGETVHFFSDLLAGKVVVITSFFSSCKGACPHLLGTFAELQKHFGDRVGRELFLLCITVDPETDTPEKLADFAEQLGAGPGWYFLTGTRENVETALHKVGHKVDDKENHSNVFVIGNEKTGLWKKAMGLSPAEQVIPVVASVLDDGR